MTQQKFHIRTALMPLCYKDFHCLASACRDTCCGGWEIAFNKKDYLRIKRAATNEELKEILSEGMSRLRDKTFGDNYAHFNIETEGFCAFQTEEGLCRLQLECGEEVLPHVCRIYPRKIFHTPVAKEFALSPSCEGVLALLWDLPQGIDFWEEPLPKSDWRVVEGSGRYDRFADIRSFCIDVLQERSLFFSQRMLLLGILLQRLRDSDWDTEESADQWLTWSESRLRDPSTVLAVENLSQDQLQFFAENTRVLADLYKHRPLRINKIYQSLFSALSADENWEESGLGTFSIDTVRYKKLEVQLDELLGHSDYFFENLMVMTAFYLMFPILASPEKLWRSYVELCSLYSFYRFAAVLGCHQELSRERLFQVICEASRGLLHNESRREKLLNERIENGGTLVQMAALTGSWLSADKGRGANR